MLLLVDPHAVTTDDTGALFVVDGGGDAILGSGVSRVVRVTAQGDVCNFGEFRLGHDLAISSDGEVYAADVRAKSVVKINAAQARCDF